MSTSESIAPMPANAQPRNVGTNAFNDDLAQKILGVLDRQEDRILNLLTDAALESGKLSNTRADGEQIIRGVLMVFREGVAGQSMDDRRMFLDTTMPAVVPHHFRWEDVLSEGLYVWGVLLSTLSAELAPEDREPASRLMGRVQSHWWQLLWNKVRELYQQSGVPFQAFADPS